MADESLPVALHEQRDIGAGAIAFGLGAVLVGLLVMSLLLFWLFPDVLADHTLHLPLPVYPSPRLQSDPAADLQTFRARELRRLNALGWRDRATDTVHLPIGDAMRAIAARGIADWPGGAGP